MKEKNSYFAFISYQRKDEEVAKRLQHSLEFYKLPIAVVEKEPSLKEGVRPIFVDMTELGDEPFLKPAIERALKDSRFLIVVCSPRSAQSKWVNKEVQYFVKLKRTKRIIPFIVEGNPNTNDKDVECCTPLLKKLLFQRELLGININEMGFDAAAVKVVSRMFHVRFSSLWNRYEKEKEEEQRRLKEQNDRLLIAQSRFIAEKAGRLIDEGDSILAKRLLLEVLPKNLLVPTRPYTVDAEFALRRAYTHKSGVLIGHTSDVTSASFSPDSSIIASASSDLTIRIWDSITGQQIKPPLEGHTLAVNSVSFSSDGKRIVSAARDKTVRIWNTLTGDCIKILTHQCGINSAVFSPDDQHIITALDDHTINIWDTETGTLLKTINGHTGLVSSAIFSSDGKYILSASWDKTVRLWNSATGSTIHIFKHSDGLNSAVFTPNDQFILSSSFDRTTRLWNTTSGELLDSFEGYRLVSLSHDGLLMALVSNNQDIIIIDTETGKMFASIKGRMRFIHSISFSPDDKSLVLTGDKFIYLCDVVNDNMPNILKEHTDVVNDAIFSPDDEMIISASDDCTIKIWDSFTGKQLKTLDGHTDAVKSISFSKDKKHFVSASHDGTVHIWDAKNLECIKILHVGIPVNLALFNPVKQQLLTSSFDNTVRIWDLKTGMIINKYFGYNSSSRSADFSPDGLNIVSIFNPDGLNIVSIFNDSVIRVFNAFNGTIQRELKVQKGNVNSVSYSPDGKLIAFSFSNKICVWDLTNGEIVKQLEGHTMDVESAVFSNDGNKILSTSYDKTICVWDLSSGKLLGTLKGHDSTIHSARFSHDGNRIVSAAGGLPGSFDLPASHNSLTDYTVRIWDFPPLQKLINKNCEHFEKYPFTLEERIKYYLE